MARRLLNRTIVTASALLALSVCTIWIASIATFYGEIVPEFRRQARAVGSDLVIQVRRALELGIPLTSLVGTQALFDSFLHNHPRLSYVELWDANQRPLYSARDADADTRLDTRRDVAIPIELEGHLVGILHVGVRNLHRAEFMRQSIWYSIMLLVAALPIAAVVLAGFVHRLVAAPVTLMRRLSDTFASGSWGVTAEVVGAPEIQRALAAVNGAFRQVAERWHRIDWLAREITGSEDVVRRLPGRIAGAKVLRVLRQNPPLTFVLFVACLPDQLTAWSAPLVAATLTPSARIETSIAGLSPVLTYIAMTLGFAALGGKLLARIRPNHLFVTGCTVSSAGELLSCVGGTLATLLLGRAMSAVGTVALVNACSTSARISHRDSAQLMSASAAVASGTALGYLVATYGSYSLALYSAVLLLLLVAPLGWTFRNNNVTRGHMSLAPLFVLALGSIVAVLAANLNWLAIGEPKHVAGSVVIYGLGMLALIWPLHQIRTRRSAQS